MRDSVDSIIGQALSSARRAVSTFPLAGEVNQTIRADLQARFVMLVT